jgi:uncharacterized membrane protein
MTSWGNHHPAALVRFRTGVLAIVIIAMILELKKPESGALEPPGKLWPTPISYGIS